MNFSSFEYILCFLPVALIAVEILRHMGMRRGPQIAILVASLCFYSASNARNLAYLLASVVANWGIAHWISRSSEGRRKHALQVGLVLNLVVLACLKYLTFLAGNLSALLRTRIEVPRLSFPLGISFYTLAQCMYLVDCYEGLVPASSFFDHVTFVTFFPYVISGPISRAKRIIPQFNKLNFGARPSSDTTARAVLLFSIGLFKKVVLADAFAFAADYGFNGNIHHLSALEAWCFVSAYACQLYFDFSGYSDMAVASAMFFGIEIPWNFDAPFRSTSIIEFWQRWHITLTQFLATYLYTPILRSFRQVNLRSATIATIVTMVIAGLWHGPAWTYVLFGTVHGVGLAINQFWRKKHMPALSDPICWLITAILVDIGFVFFRAADLPTSIIYLSRLVDYHQAFGTETFRAMRGAGIMVWLYVTAQVLGVAIIARCKSSREMVREFRPTWMTYALTTACICASIVYLNSGVTKPFIYFAF
jgi:D-alanyl-lipoteichoic acid acyltransferase DltB (MBOAT superfamily)